MLESKKKSRGGAVKKMLENIENQEGEPLARCSKKKKTNNGSC